jgi:ribulose-5-phosphate 4-epimerase/fuculose-1-phosphate aldolase
VALREAAKPRLARELADRTFQLLRHPGLLTVGASGANACRATCVFENACVIQVRAQSGGGERVRIHPQILATAQRQAAPVTKGLGGALAWPGLLRMLDRNDPSFRD